MSARCWALITASALLVGVVLATTPAGARPLVPGGSDDFPPGTGVGSGRVGAVVVRSSGASLPVVFGRAQSRYQGAQGNAETSAADLGVLGTLGSAKIFCGRSLDDIYPGERPEPLIASSGGGAEEKSTASGDTGTPLTFGKQRVAAAPNTHAEADFTGMSFEIPGLVRMGGGSSHSSTTLTPGERREAYGRSEMSEMVLGGGLVQMRGAIWTATQASGSDPGSSGTFTIGEMIVGGNAMPSSAPQEIAASMARANAVLAPLGLHITAPEVRTTEDRAEVTPMVLTFNPPSQLIKVLAPTLELLQPARSGITELSEPFSTGDCDLGSGVGTTNLVVDLLLLSFSNGGGFDWFAGGVSARTDDKVFANPFGDFGFLPPQTSTPATAPSTSAAPAPTTPASTPTTSAEIAAPAAPPNRASVSTAWSTICQTTHPSSRPSCSSGAGTAAGLVALTLTGGLAAFDRWRRRHAVKEAT